MGQIEIGQRDLAPEGLVKRHGVGLRIALRQMARDHRVAAQGENGRGFAHDRHIGLARTGLEDTAREGSKARVAALACQCVKKRLLCELIRIGVRAHRDLLHGRARNGAFLRAICRRPGFEHGQEYDQQVLGYFDDGTHELHSAERLGRKRYMGPGRHRLRRARGYGGPADRLGSYGEYGVKFWGRGSGCRCCTVLKRTSVKPRQRAQGAAVPRAWTSLCRCRRTRRHARCRPEPTPRESADCRRSTRSASRLHSPSH